MTAPTFGLVRGIRRTTPTMALLAAAVLPIAACSTDDGHGQDGQATGHRMSADRESYWSGVGGTAAPTGGRTRTYYLSADLVTWDYAPSGRNLVTGGRFDETARVFVGSGPGQIGTRYDKCLYRGYTDGSFTRRARRPAADRYLGIMGPVIHAEVGDTIKVVFRNTCPFPTSVHPHGVFYEKDSEGAPYDDDTGNADKADDAVPTGGRHTYTWKVPRRAGPGAMDGSSVMWMYHSHTDEVGDTYAGLIGPMVISAAGQARADGSPADVDRELFVTFFIDNEAGSPLLRRNMHRYGTPPMGDDQTEDEAFLEHNLKHSINGYLYGNMPVVTLERGQHVRWYVMSMGTEVDLHTPHWHGNTVTVGGMRMDVVDLLPATMVIADMVPDNPGVWLLHCHVNDHLTAGMTARYRVG